MEVQRLVLKHFNNESGVYALFTEEGKYLPLQHEVEMINEPGEMPVLRVSMWIDHENIRVEGSDVLPEPSKHGG